METLFQDLRYGGRMLLRSKAFTAVAVLSLALGIGANTTIFTIINAVFLNPLPLAEPSELMTVYGTDERNTGGFNDFMPISFPNYVDYRDQNDVFSGLVSFTGVGMSLSGDGEPEQIGGLLVTGNYFDVLGVKALQGRTFLPEEDRTPGTHPVVVLSYNLWQRRFGGDPSLIGNTITLNNQSFTVIGVAPENFRGATQIGSPDFFVPAQMYQQVLTGTFREWFTSRRALLFNVVGRLRPGVSMSQAQASLRTIAANLEQAYPRDNEKRSVSLMPVTQSAINPALRGVFVQAGTLMMTVVGLVLLIACANVANLLLARASGRRKEIAIRLSIGASRARLIRQLMTESVLLSLLGGVVGLLLAYWGRDLLWSFRPPFFGEDDLDLSLNPMVLGFTLLLSLVTGLIFGLVPALQSSRSDLVTELKDKSSQPNKTGGWLSLRNLLVVSQVALCLIALIGAGLFLRSLGNAQRIDPGFETEKMFVMAVNVGAQGYDQTRGLEFYRQVQERVRTVAGVQAATVSSNFPFGGGLQRSIFIEGQDPPAGGRGVLTIVNSVESGYFETLGIPLLRGRDFLDSDRENTTRVVIVNDAMAQRFWPGQEAIGKRFKFFGDESFYEIVGIARNSNAIFLGEDPRPIIYQPMLQSYSAFAVLYVRTAGDPSNGLGTVRNEVQALDRNLPITNVSTMSDVIGQGLWAPRMGAALLAVFGGLALLLAAIGIYGVLAYSVSQRTHERGLRMALGAQQRDVLALVMKQGAGLIGSGVVLGLAASFLLARFISSLLFGVSAADPVTFAGTPIVLAAVALLASYIPARRAARVDPMIALRYE
ncbi:MAG TPA: ABC transporter permease [Blastocatellia bacterium]|nr:ABC transporter permease [Blastocatellia bacterium]